VTALTDLFNAIIIRKQIPLDWKLNVTVPLYKGKGDVNDANNYRRISLISSVGKLFMCMLMARIQPTIEHHLHNEQPGFQPGRGAAEQLYVIDDAIERYKRKGKPLYMCFIDLSKAFDTVYRPAL
jgi:hypothetical protein